MIGIGGCTSLGGCYKYLISLGIFVSLANQALASSMAGGGPCALVFSTLEVQSQQPISKLLEAHEKATRDFYFETKRQYFQLVGGRTVYNPTKPVRIWGEMVLFGRVESLRSETDSQVIAFRYVGKNTWEPIKTFEPLDLQDPFISKIENEWVLGGVKFQEGVGYRTVFYRGTRLDNFKKFAEGPLGMKDIRLVEYGEGKILVLTRPQGVVNGIHSGKGKIALTVISSLEGLSSKVIESALPIHKQFLEGEWGGANEAMLLDNGNIGVLGHIAKWGERKGQKVRHYYAVSFEINPNTWQISTFKIIAQRSLLEGGLDGMTKPIERGVENLRDVVFAGGIELHRDGTATLWLAAGDAEVHRIRIPYPFSDR